MKTQPGRGDQGQTDLPGAQRVHKHHPLLEAIGDLDELNACVGLAAAHVPAAAAGAHEHLAGIQATLLRAGTTLAAAAAGPEMHGPVLTAADVQHLETGIRALHASLPPLHSFVLPGGHPAAGHLHVARAVCRRAERHAWAALGEACRTSPAIAQVLVYLNRLSDYLFALALRVNQQAGVPNPQWKP